MTQEFNDEIKKNLTERITDKIIELSKNDKVVGIYLNTVSLDALKNQKPYVLMHAVVDDFKYKDCQMICEDEIKFTDTVEDVDLFVYGRRYSAYEPHCNTNYCYWLYRGSIVWDPEQKLTIIKKKMNRIKVIKDKLKNWKQEQSEDTFSSELSQKFIKKLNLIKY